jgi:glutamyl-tRNA reductase
MLSVICCGCLPVLESLVLGEGQILAQVKNTHKLAQKYNTISQLLDRLFKQAMTASKRCPHGNQHRHGSRIDQFGSGRVSPC